MPGPTFESTLPDAITKAENLPSVPAVALEVLRTCENEESTVNDLALVMQRDPALSVKMLKLANSSLFSLGHEVTTLNHAAMVLGMKTVKVMSLSFSLAQSLPKDGTSGFDYEAYWHRSLLAAVSARALASRVNPSWEDEAFLAGMLSHVGQLVLVECMPEVYLDVVASAAPAWPTLQIEQEALGFHSADVANTLLQTWSLPTMIGVPVAYCARPREVPADVKAGPRELTEVLNVATLVARVICDDDNGPALMELEEAAESVLDLTGEDLEAFLVAMEEEVREAAEMLSIDLPNGEKHADILARARTQVLDITLNAACSPAPAGSGVDPRDEDVTRTSSTDELTGLPNRPAFDDFLVGEINRRATEIVPHALGLILLDLDHFQRFNDTYGREAGDAALRTIGKTLRGSIRKSDYPARYEGTTFAIVLPQTTPTFIRMVANRIRTAIERAVFVYNGEELSVTASMGGVCITRTTSARDAQTLIKVADKLLYKAKDNGRNCVEVFTRSTLGHAREESQ